MLLSDSIQRPNNSQSSSMVGTNLACTWIVIDMNVIWKCFQAPFNIWLGNVAKNYGEVAFGSGNN